jgi:hypothetical protein
MAKGWKPLLYGACGMSSHRVLMEVARPSTEFNVSRVANVDIRENDGDLFRDRCLRSKNMKTEQSTLHPLLDSGVWENNKTIRSF